MSTPAYTQEVLVTHGAAVTIARQPGARGFHIQNLGPNAITVVIGASPVVVASKGLVVPPLAAGVPGTLGPIPCDGHVPVQVIAATADQVTGAATIFVDLP